MFTSTLHWQHFYVYSISQLMYHVGKNAPFYFCTNFVKPRSILWVLAHLSFLLPVYFTFFVKWKELKFCFIHLLVWRKRICLSVCNTITFESLDLESSFFGLQLHLQGTCVKFVYEDHPVKVKVTEATRSLDLAKRPRDCRIILKSGSYTKAIKWW